jgi:hypothetical protein
LTHSSRIAFAAVALALLIAVSGAAAGCGLGPGEEVGEASLTATRDFGAETVADSASEAVDESDTVMRVLERNASIETRYGGGFVHSIDGVEADEGAADGPRDWFFFVDGIESPVGAADFPLEGGEAIWWDYRNWYAASRVPAVVGSWPAPFAHGYEGRQRPVAVECLGAAATACGVAREAISGTGARLVEGATPADAIRVLVGPWAQVSADPVAATIGDGPRRSGVYAEAKPGAPGLGLAGLDERGRPAVSLGRGAGLVAATRRLDDPPVWVVTGDGAAGALAAARLLDEQGLGERYAVATRGGEAIALPVR